MPLPKRSAPYIMGFLLVVMVVLVVWMDRALDSEEIRSHLARPPAPLPAEQISAPAAPVVAAPVVSMAIDPANAERAAQLNSDQITPEEDLDILEEFVDLYRKAFGDNPVGLNEDITAALTGTANPTQVGRLFPADSPAIRNGKLMDRWGTPYWFHPVASSKMEIRSAGPDRQLFTGDDIIKNDSGVTGGAEVAPQ